MKTISTRDLKKLLEAKNEFFNADGMGTASNEDKFNNTLEGYSFSNSVLLGLDFSSMELKGCKFIRCDLTGANFMNSNLENVDFVGSKLLHVNFSSANLTNTNFSDTRIAGAVFTDTDLKNARFNNVRFFEKKSNNRYNQEYIYPKVSNVIYSEVTEISEEFLNFIKSQNSQRGRNDKIDHQQYENSVLDKLKEHLREKGYTDQSFATEHYIDSEQERLKFDLAVIDNNQIVEVYEIKSLNAIDKVANKDSLFANYEKKLSQYAIAFFVWLDKDQKLVFKHISGDIDSFSGFYDILKRYFSIEDADYRYFFRGHASTAFNFKPSIYRDTKGVGSEDINFKEAVRKCPTEFPDHMSTFEKLVKMQHYELSTRLLDITTNPLVALYFACCGCPSEAGEVVIFKVPRSTIRYFDSDSVSVVSNIARRPDTFKMPDYKTKDEFNESEEIGYLLHEIKYEKPQFQNLINPLDLESVFCVLPKLDNPRIARQAGAFFLFGINGDKTKPAQLTSAPHRIIINSRGKETILKELASLGVDRSTLFPEIDKILQEIKKA